MEPALNLRFCGMKTLSVIDILMVGGTIASADTWRTREAARPIREKLRNNALR